MWGNSYPQHRNYKHQLIAGSSPKEIARSNQKSIIYIMKQLLVMLILIIPSWTWAADVSPYVLSNPLTNTKVAVFFIEGDIVKGDYEKFFKRYNEI